MSEEIITPERQIEIDQQYNIELLKKLGRSEEFIKWREWVVEPAIQQLEIELASEKADEMPEVILRAKLKHLNSLKYFFKDIFKQIV
jgi:hypothetical protein